MAIILPPIPLWLPSFIRFDAEVFTGLDDYYQQAYQVFSQDWQDHPPTFGGLPVAYDDRVLQWGFPEGFWHAVSQDSPNTGSRIPDITRCERILWTNTIIGEMEEGNPAIRHSLQRTQNKKARPVTRSCLFLDIPYWCHLVILERSAREYRLVSSYHIRDGSNNSRKYRQIPHIP